MTRPEAPKVLSALMGALRQEGADGTLILEQNDGCRRFYWSAGNLIYLQSDVAGEQFGNYLLRQGILDFPALSELLANEERFRLGEKVVQWGLMTVEERDLHLRSLQEQVMIHALEHPILGVEWKACGVEQFLSDDLRFQINHRHFVWSTFQEAHNTDEICDLLYEQSDWRWVASSNLLESLGDLPLNPQTAYALSFLGPEPVGFETFNSLSHGMDEGEAATLVMTLWALGALKLAQGELPSPLPRKAAAPPPPPIQAPTPVALPPVPPTPRAMPPLPPTPSQPLPTPPVPMGMPVLELDLDFAPRPDLPGPALEIQPVDLGIPALPQGSPAGGEGDSVADSPAVRARKLFLKAKNLLVQDRTVEAIRMLEQSVKMDGESDAAYEPWLLLGKHRLTNPAWSTRAIEALQVASRLRPKAAEPWSLMGEVYHRKGFKSNARACFKKALELDPSVPIPSDVDVKGEDAGIPEESAGGLFGKFRALLGGGREG